jgi:NAD(P)-dependent dehydrogenase (short-subunit alcohol dehydrogenase family)
MSQKYKKKIAVITGSAGGLGKEFARRLLLEGASICLSDVNGNLGAETLAEFSAEFGPDRVCFVQCDVTSSDDWEKYVFDKQIIFLVVIA